MEHEYREIIGYIAGTLTSFAFFPQIYKIWNTKSAQDVSLPMFVIFFSGCLLWVIYGVFSHSEPVVWVNALDCILAIIIIWMKLSYDRANKESESQKSKTQ